VKKRKRAATDGVERREANLVDDDEVDPEEAID
jgi:hypothetical protein